MKKQLRKYCTSKAPTIITFSSNSKVVAGKQDSSNDCHSCAGYFTYL